MKLAGAHEIAALLGVSRQRVNQLTTRDDFPKPVDVIAMGKVWRYADIEKWAKARNERLGRIED